MTADTIFTPSFGNKPTSLVGREKLLANFESSLKSALGSKDRALILLGQRGAGKTVLLLKFAEIAKNNGFIVCSPTIVTDGMLNRIIEKITHNESLKKHKKKARITGGNIGAFGFSAGLNIQDNETANNVSFQQQLFELTRLVNEQGKGLLILIDELQANSQDVKNLIIAYQELVGEQMNISLVMAGLPGAVSATLNEKVLTFLNRAKKITLEPLKSIDVMAYFKSSFQKLGIALTSEQLSKATEATKGSPYMMQLVGHNIVVNSNSAEIYDENLDNAIRLAESDYINDICKTTLNALSDKDIKFLEAMSVDATVSNISDIASRMNVSQDYAQKYRKRLIDAGVIVPQGRGRVVFDVPYLKDFLRSNAY